MCGPLSYCMCTCQYDDTHSEILKNNHLFAGKELPLVLVDNSVTCGHFAILIPRNWTQEISWVGQTIGSCKTDIHSHAYVHIYTKYLKSLETILQPCQRLCESVLWHGVTLS